MQVICINITVYVNNAFYYKRNIFIVAGSAGFAGANTGQLNRYKLHLASSGHVAFIFVGALSSAVIAFEITGQLTHLLPIIVCVIIANLVAQYLGPSIYDSLIKLKNLPYLPRIIQPSSSAHRIFVQDFMQRDLLYGRCISSS